MTGMMGVTASSGESLHPTYAFVPSTLGDTREVTLTVRRVGGDVVCLLSRGVTDGAAVEMDWDGLDAAGRRAPRGLYLVEAATLQANGAVSHRVETVCIRS
jgi:hypothetical protein